MSRTYRTRFAPSPTGALHLGHARTHLVAWLSARSTNGRIVMRLDDLDAPRVRPGAADAILRDHEWLGLDWDEGPIRQSDRTGRYREALERLSNEGHTYPCTCSRTEIESVASAPHGDEGPVYPGTCRNGPTHPERTPAIRFRMPEPPPRFVDRLAGAAPAESGRGDFVLLRADGIFAYHLACVVDDVEMDITEVVRGHDLLSSTPRQIALIEALGATPPSYLHVPLVRGVDGERLAKRHGAIAIASFRDAGTSPEQLFGVLAFSLGLRDDDRPVSLAELRASFSIDRLAVPEGDARHRVSLP